MTKEGEGPGFLDENTHTEIHLWNEIQKIDDEQFILHVKRVKIMKEIGKIYDKRVKEPYRFEHSEANKK